MIRTAVSVLCLALLLVAVPGCLPRGRDQDDKAKITFDLDPLDEEGLRGPPDGRRALSYEFCIPNTPRHVAEVSAIDSTVQCMAGSPGRIGCGADQSLCIGSTHQEDFRGVLRQLAELEYVERIDEAFFE